MNDLYYQEIEPKMLFWSQFMDLKKKMIFKKWVHMALEVMEVIKNSLVGTQYLENIV